MCLNFSVWVTTACNLRCTYCYEGKEKKVQNLSAEQASAIVEYIKKKAKKLEREKRDRINIINIELHGGEPLVNFQGIKDFVNIAKRDLGEYKISYQMTINGTILSDEILLFLKENISHLTISFDGDEFTQNLCRIDAEGKGTYDIVKENSIRLLEIFGDKLRVRMTFNSKTVTKLSNNIIHIANLGFKIIIALPDIFDKEWNDEKVEAFNLEIGRIKQSAIDKKTYINLKQPVVLQKKGMCSGGCDGENILPNGDIYCCTMATGIQEFYIGNISTGIEKQIVDEILRHSSEKMDICSECSYCIFCDCVRCRIINKLVNNSYSEPIGIQCAFNNLLIKNNGFER